MGTALHRRCGSLLALPARCKAPFQCSRIVRQRRIAVRAEGTSGKDDGDISAQREQLEKLSKISGGQYLFNRVREKAEGKVGRLINRSREDWLDYEKREFLRDAPMRDDADNVLTAPVWNLKLFLQGALLRVVEWPFVFVVRAINAVTTALHSKVNAEEFEMFLMAEGEKIWRWRNRTQNERWFWSFFLFRSLLPTVLGIVVYEAFVPNNIIWAVVVPYAFYWFALRCRLSPLMFDWWLVAYFGFYAKCWPGIAAALSAFFFGY